MIFLAIVGSTEIAMLFLTVVGATEIAMFFARMQCNAKRKNHPVPMQKKPNHRAATRRAD
jgi:hypothetical protein